MRNLDLHRQRSRNRLRVQRRQSDRNRVSHDLDPKVRYLAPVSRSVYLVAKRPPLKDHPLIWRWLMRRVCEQLEWAPEYGIDYGGVYLDKAEARHAAAEYGGFIMELPWCSLLPPETCQYGEHDFPLSEASHEYRNRRRSYVAMSRETINQIIALEQLVDHHYEDQCIA